MVKIVATSVYYILKKKGLNIKNVKVSNETNNFENKFYLNFCLRIVSKRQ